MNIVNCVNIFLKKRYISLNVVIYIMSSQKRRWFPLTQTNSFDAFTMWKEMYDKTEHAWRDVIQDTLGKEYFAEGLGQIQGQYLQYQEIVNKMSEAYLKSVNMPSREEVSNIATLIINADAKIDQLEDQLDDYQQSSSKEIEQLKKSVSHLDKKLDKILDLLEKQAVKQEESPVVKPEEKQAVKIAPSSKAATSKKEN